jgi:Predicted metal-binding, possibly nucleic acid-binding protein
VKKKHSYSIAIKGLAAGIHTFSFEIDNLFFGEFEGSEVEQGKLEATVTVEKKSSFVQLGVKISGEVTVACDRCLDDLLVPIAYEANPIVQFVEVENKEEMSADEEILYLDPMESELDLLQYFFDSIILSIPMQHVHTEGQCNKEMIEKLKELEIK